MRQSRFDRIIWCLTARRYRCHVCSDRLPLAEPQASNRACTPFYQDYHQETFHGTCHMKPKGQTMTYAPSDLITPSMIEAAEKAKACGEAIRWLRARKALTWQGLADANPDWLLWAAKYIGSDLPLELINACAEWAPCESLCYAAQYLTPDRLDACAEAAPWAALAYAAQYLTPERLVACRKAMP